MSQSSSTRTPKSPKTPAKPGTVGNPPLCFDKSQVVGYYPNRTTRRKLADEWKSFSPEKQLEVRAARSKRGIKCDICGLTGYFRENCPNQCISPPSTPDSLDSTPPSTPDDSLNENDSLDETIETEPTGVFWGDSKDASIITGKKSSYQMKQKPDLSTLRPLARDRQAELRNSDATSAGNFTFFCHSDHTYARSYAELTLQQVMRRMMRLLEKQLIKNANSLEADFDTTLLHPPSDKLGKKFYPDEFLEIKDFREYFYKKESTIKGNLNYKYQGNIRPVDDLDSLFRGPSLDTSGLYETKGNAGESIHAKNTWKSNLAKHDILANSDPIMAKKQEKINQLFKNQSKWIEMQSKSMTYRNDRFEHMVFILKNEIQKEHEREGKLLAAENKRVSKNLSMDIYQERLASVDMMMNVLQSYKFTAGLDEADFLLFCLERWEEETKIRLLEEYRKHGVDPVEEDARLTLTYGENHYKSQKLRNKKKVDDSKKMGESKDLIAASTHPYYQDQQFLAKMKKKQDRLMSKAISLSLSCDRKIDSTESAQTSSLTPLHSQSFLNGFDAKDRSQSANELGDIGNDERNGKSLDDKNSGDEDIVSISHKRFSHRKASKSSGSIIKRRKHPKEIDQEHIAKMKQSFRRAGLANRIRKGNDDDYAHALPALIPIPKAFDGNSQVSSYTGQNIIFKLKKDMVLSDIGYTRQTAVPLYVRNSLFEKEGTSVNGDPTQEELAVDRRYSHYLGRPFVRFNKPKTPPPPREERSFAETVESFTPPPLKTDLTALMSFDLPCKDRKSFKTLQRNEYSQVMPLDVDKNVDRNTENLSNISETISVSSGGQSLSSSIGKNSVNLSMGTMDKAARQALRRERRHAKTVPISRSLVRLVFKPEPNLADLKYLDDEF